LKCVSTKKRILSNFVNINFASTALRTFKYYMTLQGGGGLLKASECRHIGRGGIWPNRHITIIAAEKA